MPKIDYIETFLVDLLTIRSHRLSVTTMAGQTLMIIRIYTSDGLIGVGEGTTIGGLAYGPESPEGMKLTIDNYIAPTLYGCDPIRIQETVPAMGKTVKGKVFAEYAVQTALLEPHGHSLGV